MAREQWCSDHHSPQHHRASSHFQLSGCIAQIYKRFFSGGDFNNIFVHTNSQFWFSHFSSFTFGKETKRVGIQAEVETPLAVVFSWFHPERALEPVAFHWLPFILASCQNQNTLHVKHHVPQFWHCCAPEKTHKCISDSLSPVPCYCLVRNCVWRCWVRQHKFSKS